MGPSKISVRTFLLWAAWLQADTVHGGAIAAWWTDLGPSLMLQNDQSGEIQYSLCNSNSTPVLPANTSITIPLDRYPPKSNSPLAGTGWYDGNSTWASIFYQDAEDQIVNSLLQCNSDTGYWHNNGDYIVSSSVPNSVSSSTGLAAVLLGSADGYRVFYHDSDGTLRNLGYTVDTQWSDYGVVSSDNSSGNAIGATFYSAKNISVVTPKNSGNMEISVFNSDQTWHISTFPRNLTTLNATNSTSASSFNLNTSSTPSFTLPSFDGKPGAIGIAANNAGHRDIFYIGSDQQVHQVSTDNATWSLAASQNETAWPKADDAKAQIAVACNPELSQLRLFYMSGGKVMQANGDGGSWSAAESLPDFNISAPATTSSSSSGLSEGAKIGIGVGVGVGVPVVAGILLALVLLRRRKRSASKAQQEREQQAQQQQPPVQEYPGGGYPQSSYSQGTYGSPESYGWPPYSPPQEKKSPTPPPGELEAPDTRVELPTQREAQEMLGEGHYREAP